MSQQPADGITTANLDAKTSDGNSSGLTAQEKKELTELREKFENLTINKLKNRQRKELQTFQNDWKKQLKSCQKSEKRNLQRSKKQKENELRNSHKKELNCFNMYNMLLKKEIGPSFEEIEREKEEIEYKLRMKFFYEKKRAKEAKQKQGKKNNSHDNKNNNDDGIDDSSNFQDLQEKEKHLLSNILSQLGFDIFDISSDGHCLFRAIEHQLSFIRSKNGKNVKKNKDDKNEKNEKNDKNDKNGKNDDSQQQYYRLNYLELRRLCHDFMKENSHIFLPFFLNDDGQLMTQDEYLMYCNKIIDYDSLPVMWGGHNEIVALSRALDIPIIIHAAYNRPQIVYHKDHSKLTSLWHEKYANIHEKLASGNKNKSQHETKSQEKSNNNDNNDNNDSNDNNNHDNDGNVSNKDAQHESKCQTKTDDENDVVAIHLSYHENLYTLGEHYNSVVTRKFMQNLQIKKEGQWKTVGASKKKRR